MYYLFSVKAEGRLPFLLSKADKRRFERLLVETFTHEKIKIENYILRKGYAYVLFCDDDPLWLVTMMRVVCAGFGRYRAFTGRSIHFERIVAIPVCENAVPDIKKKIFHGREPVFRYYQSI